MRNNSTILKTAAALGGLAVIMGAFGAHAFKDLLIQTGRTETFELAVRYQFYHALSLLATGILMKDAFSKHFTRAAWTFLSGTIFFCGSLYLLCFTQLKTFAFVTPFGGVMLVVGWVLLFLGISGNKKSLNK